jgi:hypothetical protein
VESKTLYYLLVCRANVSVTVDTQVFVSIDGKMGSEYSIVESADPSKVQKRQLQSIGNYTFATFGILVAIVVIGMISGIISWVYVHPRIVYPCDSGDPTITSTPITGGCIDIPKGLGAPCTDQCITERSGAVALDPETHARICSGTPKGTCYPEGLSGDPVECPPLVYKDIVIDHMANESACAMGKCMYLVGVPNATFVDDIAAIINEDTAGDALNQFCMNFISNSDPNKQCLQAFFFPMEITDSAMICAYTFRRSRLDFDILEEMFYPTPPEFNKVKETPKTKAGPHQKQQPAPKEQPKKNIRAPTKIVSDPEARKNLFAKFVAQAPNKVPSQLLGKKN